MACSQENRLKNRGASRPRFGPGSSEGFTVSHRGWRAFAWCLAVELTVTLVALFAFGVRL